LQKENLYQHVLILLHNGDKQWVFCNISDGSSLLPGCMQLNAT